MTEQEFFFGRSASYAEREALDEYCDIALEECSEARIRHAPAIAAEFITNAIEIGACTPVRGVYESPLAEWVKSAIGQNPCREIDIGSSAVLDPDSDRNWLSDGCERRGPGKHKVVATSHKIDSEAMRAAVRTELERQGLRLKSENDDLTDESDLEYVVDEFCDSMTGLIEATPGAGVQGLLTDNHNMVCSTTVQKWAECTPAQILADIQKVADQVKGIAAAGTIEVMSNVDKHESLFFSKQLQTAQGYKCDRLIVDDPHVVYSIQKWAAPLLQQKFTTHDIKYPSMHYTDLLTWPLPSQGLAISASYTCHSYGCPERPPSPGPCHCYTCGKSMDRL